MSWSLKFEGDHTNVLELSVAKSDMGKDIGRKGRTAQAKLFKAYSGIKIYSNHQTVNGILFFL